MKTVNDFKAAPKGSVVAWFVYYNDDDSLCCITDNVHKADAYKLMNYTVIEVYK